MTAIVGIGALSAAGIGAKAGWHALLTGASFLTPHALFPPHLSTTPLTGMVPNFSQEPFFSRTEALAAAAIEEALTGLPLPTGRVGLILGTTVGGLDQSEKFYPLLKNDPTLLPQAGEAFKRHEAGALTAFLAQHFSCDGFHTVSTACSSGLHAIGMAHRMIEEGLYDRVIAVGVDALSFLTLRGFDSLLLVDYAGAKPFDEKRLGISLGEGAGALVLEKSPTSIPLAFVEGWGATADAYHMTAPHPEGLGAQAAIRQALAHLPAETPLDWIIAHGTGTPDNDAAEVSAFKGIFGPAVPPFTSLKGALGHTLAASGALEVVYGILSLQNQQALPTVNCTSPDPALLAPLTSALPIKGTHFLKTAFGFGGNNGALLIAGGAA